MLNGEIIQGQISDVNEDKYFVQHQGTTYALDKNEIEKTLSIGDPFHGFVYEDKNHRLRITSLIPEISKEDFGWAKVVDIRRDLGVFVDIGLPDKDIVISLDELPEGNQFWPQKEDMVYIKLSCDSKNRLWGHLAVEEDLQKLATKAGKQLMNYNVEARVYKILNVGAQVFTTQNLMGFIHESEMLNPVRLGELVSARIIDVHPDGKINISSRPRAYQAIEDDSQMLLALLKKNPNHYLPLHDKTDPDIIKDYLGISKGQFKRAVGGLLKEKRIRQEKNDGIYLLDNLGEGDD